MTWKSVTPAFTGDAQHFGGTDGLNKVADLFSGVLDVDVVDMNSVWTFRSSKAKIRNPANTFSYTLVAAAIGANYNLTLPASIANDTLASWGTTNVFSAQQKFAVAGQSPILMYRPIANIGNLIGVGMDMNDSAANETAYGGYFVRIEDPTDGVELGALDMQVLTGGTLLTAVRVNSSGVVEMGVPNQRRIRLDATGLTANRVFTFPNATTTLAGTALNNNFTAAQKITAAGNPITFYRQDNTLGQQVQMICNMNDSAGAEKTYGRWQMTIIDNTAGVEYAEATIALLYAGVLSTAFRTNNSGQVHMGTPGLLRLRLDEAGLTAARVFTFPNLTCQLAASNQINTFTTAQKFDVNVKVKPLPVPGTDAAYGIFYVDSGDANKPKYKYPSGTVLDLSATGGGGGGGGEANTASNTGTAGVGVFVAKVGVDLQFRNIAPETSYVRIVNDAGANEIDIGLAATVAKTDIANTYTATSINSITQKFDAGIKIKPITVPTTDAAYGQYYADSADSNKPKYKYPSGAVVDLSGSGGGGGSSSFFPTANYIIRISAGNYVALNTDTNNDDFTGTNFRTVLLACVGALPTGGKIWLGPGDFSLTALTVITQDNIFIQGCGVDVTRILYDTPTTLGSSLQIGTNAVGTQHLLTANALKGQRVITGDSTGIAVGDWIFMTRLVYVDVISITRFDGEFHKVFSIDSPTQITVEENLYEDYLTADTADYYRAPFTHNFTLKDITLRDNRVNVATTGIGGPTYAIFCYNLHFDNVKLENMTHDSLRTESCFFVSLSNLFIETPQSAVDDVDHQYGLYVTGATTNLNWTGGWANKCRHSMTNNTNSGGIYRRGRQRNLTFNGLTSFNANVAHWDLHQAAIGVSFTSCLALSGQHSSVSADVQGFNLRSPATVTGCVIQCASHEAMVVWVDSDVAGDDAKPGGNRSVITGCTIINMLKDDADTVTRGIVVQEFRGSVVITSNNFFNINSEVLLCNEPVDHIIFSNNMMTTCGASLTSSQGLITVLGNMDSLNVTNNMFASGTPSTSGRPLTVATSVDHMTFTGNDVVGLTNVLPTLPAISTDVWCTGNPGLNPINKITNHTNATTHTIGWYGGATAAVVASTDYTIVGGSILMTCTTATSISITIKDGAGNTVVTGLTTLSAQSIPNGYKINFGPFTGTAPTVTVFAL